MLCMSLYDRLVVTEQVKFSGSVENIRDKATWRSFQLGSFQQLPQFVVLNAAPSASGCRFVVPYYIHVNKFCIVQTILFPFSEKSAAPSLSPPPPTELFSKCHSDCHSCSKGTRPVMRPGWKDSCLSPQLPPSLSLSLLSSHLTVCWSWLSHQKLLARHRSPSHLSSHEPLLFHNGC